MPIVAIMVDLSTMNKLLPYAKYKLSCIITKLSYQINNHGKLLVLDKLKSN